MVPGSLELNCPPMETRGRAIRGYQDLEVWKRAMDLVAESYSATRAFPPDERYGLKAQIRRSAVSIPSNIAEGRGRQGLGGFMYHLSVANGSLMELETQFLIAHRLEYLDQKQTNSLTQRFREVGRLLAGLLRALRARKANYQVPDTRYQVPRT